MDSSITFIFAVVLAHYCTDAVPPAETCFVIADHWAQWQYDMNYFLHVEEQQSEVKPRIDCMIAPNPTTCNANISFTLSSAGKVTLKLYDASGRLVQNIVDSNLNAGNHCISLSTQGFAQGMYFAVLETPQGKNTQSFVVLR